MDKPKTIRDNLNEALYEAARQAREVARDYCERNDPDAVHYFVQLERQLVSTVRRIDNRFNFDL